MFLLSFEILVTILEHMHTRVMIFADMQFFQKSFSHKQANTTIKIARYRLVNYYFFHLQIVLAFICNSCCNTFVFVKLFHVVVDMLPY
jgi:hypothetical protein